MSPLEIALVILVSIWSLIFLVMAIAMVILLIWLKKALDKVNRILEQGEEVANGIGAIGKVATTGAVGLLLREGVHQMKRVIVKKKSTGKKAEKR